MELAAVKNKKYRQNVGTAGPQEHQRRDKRDVGEDAVTAIGGGSGLGDVDMGVAPKRRETWTRTWASALLGSAGGQGRGMGAGSAWESLPRTWSRPPGSRTLAGSSGGVRRDCGRAVP